MLIDRVIGIKKLINKLLISSILILLITIIIYSFSGYRLVLEGFEIALVASIIYHLILILIFLDLKKLINRDNIKITRNFLGGIYELIIVVIYNLITHFVLITALIVHKVGIIDISYILIGFEFILVLGVAGSYSSRKRKYLKGLGKNTFEFAQPIPATSFDENHEDKILMFIDESTVNDPFEYTSLDKVYSAYVKWCFIYRTRSLDKYEFINWLREVNLVILEIEGEKLLKGKKLLPIPR